MTSSSSPSPTPPAESEAVCTYCGAAIDASEWHPAEFTRVEGDLVVCSFCDESCRADWREGR
ncbi:MAG: hypothetical protein ABEJ06_05285 [Haloarculaceae archaeon]